MICPVESGPEVGEREHQILLGAKDSLLGVSDVSAVERKRLLRAYQEVERELFGKVVFLEGEKNLLE